VALYHPMGSTSPQNYGKLVVFMVLKIKGLHGAFAKKNANFRFLEPRVTKD
jgi:hypothetical protein